MTYLLALFERWYAKEKLEFDKALKKEYLVAELMAEYNNRKSYSEIREYVDRLTIEEIEQLTKPRKLS